jgi:predicted nucleic acid-binding protein
MRTGVAERCELDTDVASYIFRRDTWAELYHDYLADKRLAVSFMTVAELRRWALAHGWGEPRRQRLEGYLRRFDVHYSSDAIRTAWATIVAQGERQGRPVAPSDAWVAAPAWVEGIPLVTHNRRHFADIAGLETVSFAPA